MRPQIPRKQTLATYVQCRHILKKPGRVAYAEDAGTTLRAEAVSDPLRAEVILFQAIFTGVPGYVARFWVDQ